MAPRSVFFPITLILILHVVIGTAAVRYVTPAGAGAMNGSSWGNAAPGSSLQTIINTSSSGDQVWVAAGTYHPTSGTDRTISYAMKEGVGIYGSFSGTETSLIQRTLISGPSSILSGEIGSAGNSDNTYNVIRNGNLSRVSILDGFIIRDGHDDRTASASEGLGGGIYNESTIGGASSPTIRRCVVINNRATYGAGIFNNGFNGRTSSPLISHCIITGNTATGAGGGIDNFGVTGSASPEIVNCLIAANSAPVAGGIYCWGGDNGSASPSIINTAIVNNTATGGNAGGIIADNLNQFGGYSGSTAPVLKNCILWGNSATGAGPQFSVAGTGTVQATYSIVNLSGQSSPHLLSGATTGNGTADPLFVNSASGAGTDGNWMTSDDGFRLQSSSPAIDAGNGSGIPDYDLIYGVRSHGSSVDIGPYEDGAAAFPVELTSFTAVPNGSSIELLWNTATEQNNLGFEIQRSESDDRVQTAESTLWSTIGFVEGHGSSNTPQEYRFADRSVRARLYRYRLKQIDRDGGSTFSSMIEISAGSVPSRIMLEQNYPNPFNPSTMIGFSLPVSGLATLTVYDAIGREVSVLVNEYLEAGVYHQRRFDAGHLASGVYIMRLSSGAMSDHRTMALKK